MQDDLYDHERKKVLMSAVAVREVQVLHFQIPGVTLLHAFV